jgi:hypothetical protein
MFQSGHFMLSCLLENDRIISILGDKQPCVVSSDLVQDACLSGQAEDALQRVNARMKMSGESGSPCLSPRPWAIRHPRMPLSNTRDEAMEKDVAI